MRDAVPDLADLITASIALPARRVLRARHLMRAALFVVGAIQLAVGVPALFGDDLGMAMSAHGAHEGAAWNLAIGVAFVAAASVCAGYVIVVFLATAVITRITGGWWPTGTPSPPAIPPR